MQYVEEQQFMSQEIPGKVAQQSNQFKTIFGKDSASAFATQPSPMQNLMSIVGGIYQGVDAAGKTFQTAVDIDKQKDARMARNLEEQMKVIDSDPDLTPEQKQWAKFKLQGEGFQSALRPETKDYYKYSQDITMNNVEFLDDTENFANTLLAFQKKALKMTAEERLEKLPGMFRTLEESYPGFSDKIREQARASELKTHELIWKENAGKTAAAWDIALQEVFSTPSLQDPAKLYSMTPEAIYNMAAGIMDKNTDTGSLMENVEDDSALRDILMTKANESLFAGQANARHNQKMGRLTETARMIGTEERSGSYDGIWGALEFGGIGVISQLATNPAVQAESNLGVSFGKNLQSFRNMLYRTPSPDMLLKFYEAANYQRFNLENAEEQFGVDSDQARLKNAFDYADRLRERRNNGETIGWLDLAPLRLSAGYMIESELQESYNMSKGREDPNNEFAFQALKSFTDDHGPVDGIGKHLQKKEFDEENEQSVFESDLNSVEFYLGRRTEATNWEQTSNTLQVGTSAVIANLEAERDLLNLDMFNYFKDPAYGQSSLDSADVSTDIQTLTKARNELMGIMVMPSPMQAQQNDRKNEIVKTIFSITNAYDLTIPKPVRTDSADMERLSDLSASVAGWDTKKTFLEGKPIVVNAFRDKPVHETRNLFQGIRDLLNDGFNEVEEFVPDIIEEDILKTMEDFDKLLNDPNATTEDIASVGMGLLTEFEMFAEPDQKDSNEWNAWSYWTGQLGTIKKNILSNIKQTAKPNEFLDVKNSNGDVYAIGPNPENAEQWGRTFLGILPIAASGGINSEIQNPETSNASIEFLSKGIQAIGESFATGYNSDPNLSQPERIAKGFEMLTPNQRDILAQYHQTARDPLTSYQIPEKLKRDMRDAFIVPMLNEQTRGEYERLRKQARSMETGAIAAETITTIDYFMPVFSNPENPVDTARAAQGLNIALSNFNKQGSYIDGVRDITFDNADPIFVGLKEALNRPASAAYVNDKGYLSVLPGEVTLNQRWGLMLTGEITNVGQEELQNLAPTPTLDFEMLTALYGTNDNLRTAAAQLNHRQQILQETLGPLMGEYTGTSPDADLQQRGRIVQGSQLAAGLNSGEQIILAIEPTSINAGLSEGALRRNASGQWIDKKDAVITDAAQIRELLEKDMSGPNPNWQVKAHKIGTPNIPVGSTSEHPANLASVSPVDPAQFYASPPSNAMVPETEQRRTAALAQTPAPKGATSAIVRHMTESPLSNLRKAAELSGQSETVFGIGFVNFLQAFESDVATNNIPNSEGKNVSVAIDGNVQRNADKEDGTKAFGSNQRYGRSAAVTESFMQGYAILNHEIGLLIEEGLTGEELAEAVNRITGELAQQIGTENGLRTFRRGEETLDFIGNDTRKDYPYPHDLMDSVQSSAYADPNYRTLMGHTLDPGQSQSERAITSSRSNYNSRINREQMSKETKDNLGTQVTAVRQRGSVSAPHAMELGGAGGGYVGLQSTETYKYMSWTLPVTPYRAWLYRNK